MLKFGRSTQVNYLEDTVQQEELETVKTENLETENDPVAFAEFFPSNGWEDYQIDTFSVMANGHIFKLKTNSEQLFAFADSVSPISFLNEKIARRLQQNNKEATFKTIPTGDTARSLACYNHETIVPKGKLIIAIESGGWRVQSAPFIVTVDKKANIIGRNLLPQIGIKLIQEQQKQIVHAIRELEESGPAIKQRIKENFTQLCVRIRKSKNHTMKTQFIKEFVPIQQKRRRIPIHLQKRVEGELNKLIDQKHLIKLDKCLDRQLINLIIITVKKDQTVKLALNSKKINKFIHKNKYQMPNFDLLLDNIAQVVKSYKTKQTLFSKLDLQYAYSQIPLDQKTSKQCNFNLIGGNASGTYQFETGFYGLTEMPAEFKKASDLTLTNCTNTYAYLDDILIVTKGSTELHQQKLKAVFDKLDEENLVISLEKAKFPCKQNEWLGFNINSDGTTLLIKKTEAIEKPSVPKTFKQLKSFMGSIHHLTRYKPNLAQAAAALRPLLKNTEKKKSLEEWSTKHNTAFKNILKLVAAITQNKHFDQHLETRIVCTASNTGLGAALEQNSTRGWIAIAYASRFLNSLEEKYSVNELEVLGVVWAIEHFKYYLYGKHFTVIADHQALISALKASERSKTSQSRLTRWIDRLMPFHFDIKHLAGFKLGLIDYMSRNPVGLAEPPQPV